MSKSKRLPITMEESGSEYNGPFSTFPEWHAAALGVGLGFVLALSLLISQTVSIIVAATMVRTVIFAHTGRRLKIAGQTVDLPDKYLRQTRNEPHYLDSGILFGVSAGFTFLLLFSSFPS